MNEDQDRTFAPELDPALLPLFGFLRHFTELGIAFPEDPLAPIITEMKLDLPLDLDIVKREDDSLQLGGAPPDIYAPITLMPVYHRLKITIAISDEALTE